MEAIHPTRTNLLAKRAQIKLARQGADLLTRKKDALLQEFFEVLHTLAALRDSLVRQLEEAAGRAVLTEGVLGTYALASAALAGGVDVEVTTRIRNLWGVRVLVLEHGFQPTEPLSRPYSPRGGELPMDELAGDFEPILIAMLELAPHELTLRKLGEEIRKTNRKINALEQQLIPRLRAQARAIAEALEERARDDRFRLKCMKRKKEGAAA